METYNTYQEAKIANPDVDIVTTGKRWVCDFKSKAELKGKFEPFIKNSFGRKSHKLEDEGWVICNPFDYCKSLEEFFKEGYNLVDGDVILNMEEKVFIVGDTISLAHANERVPDDRGSFILFSKALIKN